MNLSFIPILVGVNYVDRTFKETRYEMLKSIEKIFFLFLGFVLNPTITARLKKQENCKDYFQ